MSLTLAHIDAMVAVSKAIPSVRPTASGHYVMMISDDMRAYLVMACAKERWKRHYRAVRLVKGRLARRRGA